MNRVVCALLSLLFVAVAWGSGPVASAMPHDPVDAGEAGPRQDRPSRSSLVVKVRTPIKGIKGKVTVRGPRGFTRVLRKSVVLRGVRPGKYRLVAAPARNAKVTAYASVRKVVVKVPAGRKAKAIVVYNSVVSNRTTVLSAGAISDVARDVADDGSAEVRRVVLSGRTTYKRGDLLVAGITEQTPEGLMVQVRKANRNVPRRGLTTYQVRRAAITSVVPVGQLDSTFTLNESSASVDVARRAVTPVVRCNHADGTSEVTNISYTPTIAMTMLADWNKLKPGSSYIELSVEKTGTLAADYLSTTAQQCSGSVELLSEKLPAVRFMIGPVPIVVVPKLTIDLGLWAKVSHGIEMTGSLTAGTKVGMRAYGDGRAVPVWDPTLSSTTKPSSPSGGELSGDLTGTMDLSLTIEARVYLYDLLGAFGRLTPSYGADLEPDEEAWLTVGGKIAAEVGVGAEKCIELWGPDLCFGVEKSLSFSTDRQIGDVFYRPQITTHELPGGAVGMPYSEQLTTKREHSSSVWRVAAGQLPPGLELGADGRLSGTPRTEGDFEFAVEVKTALGPRDQRSLELSVGPRGKPVIVVPNPVKGRVAEPFDVTLRTSDDRPGTWAFDALPAGLVADGGRITGTPESPSLTTVGVTFTDVAGRRVSAVFSLEIADRKPPEIVTTTLEDAETSWSYEQPLVVKGDVAGRWSTVSGRLPDGLTVVDPNGGPGAITGVPVESGEFEVTLRFTDAYEKYAERTFELTVIEDRSTVTVLPSPATAAHEAGEPDVSPDGRFVVYSALDPEDPGVRSVFLWNRVTNATGRIATNAVGPVVSEGGLYVAYTALSEDGVALHRWSAETGGVDVVSPAVAGEWASEASPRVRISDDGRFVAFNERADHGGGELRAAGVRRWDAETGDTAHVTAGEALPYEWMIEQLDDMSGDGHRILFTGIGPDAPDSAYVYDFARGGLAPRERRSYEDLHHYATTGRGISGDGQLAVVDEYFWQENLGTPERLLWAPDDGGVTAVSTWEIGAEWLDSIDMDATGSMWALRFSYGDQARLWDHSSGRGRDMGPDTSASGISAAGDLVGLVRGPLMMDSSERRGAIELWSRFG